MNAKLNKLQTAHAQSSFRRGGNTGRNQKSGGKPFCMRESVPVDFAISKSRVTFALVMMFLFGAFFSANVFDLLGE
jgi:hypothetical protein